ncbi:MAG: citrate/2-methylcitrate synthase [Eubacteriales bacterium]|nr:citrate/2-methylcitrate synthase [Eubacteriales bacterium]
MGIESKNILLAERNYSGITQDIVELASKCQENSRIDHSLYDKYEVKRGLRDLNGKGVLTGLTEISEIKASEVDENGVSHPCDGKLYYRGIDVEDIIKGFTKDKRFGFEETTYLLIFGEMPDENELKAFSELLGEYRSIPSNFVRDIIMKKPSKDIMNALARCVLMLYSYDNKADDVSVPNVVRQCLQLISQMPLLAVYSYQAYKHSYLGGSLIIHEPNPKLSTAENILHLLRADGKYTELEAELLDIALVLHAEHGGGNNSTFTTHVVTSSGTDTYSTVVSSLASLKGPKHGGANIKVVKMFEDIKENVKDWDNEEELTAYVARILHKDAFDRTGLVYGMGHAVYSLSDPRARVFKSFVEELSIEKGREAEYKLMADVERIAAKLISKERKIYKGVSANVDFYSGFVYSMLGLPSELFTPIFAIARISGWSAHRLEELMNCNKIIRPAYMNVCDRHPYVPLSERKK